MPEPVLIISVDDDQVVFGAMAGLKTNDKCLPWSDLLVGVCHRAPFARGGRRGASPAPPGRRHPVVGVCAGKICSKDEATHKDNEGPGRGDPRRCCTGTPDARDTSHKREHE